MSKIKFNLFSKEALMAAVVSVSMLSASCTKDDMAVAPQTNTEASAASTGQSQGSQDQYIITMDETSPQQIQSLLSDNGISAEVSPENTFSNGFILNLNPSEASALRHDSRIKSIERDMMVNAAQGTMAADATATQTISWGVTKVGGAGDGTGKTAWVIDSGVEMNHPDLNVDQTRSKSFLTADMGGNWSSPTDEYGHGTQVAGIIGAKNDGNGAVGVAAGATIVSLRIMNYAGACYSSALIKALDYVYANGKAGDVVNLSCAFPANGTIDYYVQKVASRGIFISIAAGNSNADAVTKSPSRVNGTNIYTVSGMNSDGSRVSTSNYGATTVDYAAPGANLYTTTKGGGYVNAGGTSMAAPHLAGILLLNGGRVNNSGLVSGDPDGKADPIASR